jgi:DNA-binding NarL/FixJ family response regulator
MLPVKTFIVEDSPIILDNLVATLEELAPVDVIGSAPDEDTAVNWLTADGRDVDLVIIDVFLKSGSGLGVLRRAAQRSVPGKRVVLTNYATNEMRKKCLELGADRVFDKSNELDDLLLYCSRLADGAADTGLGALTP